jgi:hypothetical protein
VRVVQSRKPQNIDLAFMALISALDCFVLFWRVYFVRRDLHVCEHGEKNLTNIIMSEKSKFQKDMYYRITTYMSKTLISDFA